MKATINGSGPATDALKLEAGHWYWVELPHAPARLSICAHVGDELFNLIDPEDGLRHVTENMDRPDLISYASRSGWTITPAKVTINAE